MNMTRGTWYLYGFSIWIWHMVPGNYMALLYEYDTCYVVIIWLCYMNMTY